MKPIQIRQQLIQSVHDSSLKLNLVIAGGGSGLVSELLGVAGASNTLFEASIPYSPESLSRFIGSTPDTYCSSRTAKAMAVQAYLKFPETVDSNLFAVSITAAIATERAKKGPHRFYLAIQGRSLTRLVHAELAKGRRSRQEEENLIIETGLFEIAKLAQLEYPSPRFEEGDRVTFHEHLAPSCWIDVFHGDRSFCRSDRHTQPPTQRGLLSGSFDPLHAGHLEMAEVVEKRIGVKVDFEIAVHNADKPSLDYLTLAERISRFQSQTVWLSRNATFAEKATCFPGNIFLVGADTITRIADPRYYTGENSLSESIDRIKQNHCRFVVFGRHEGNQFVTLKTLDLPRELHALCEEIPMSEFSNKISSTTIRHGLEPGVSPNT